MRVVKLGGSLIAWDRLPECLNSLVDLGVAIVPGGGPFADQVRQAQQRWRFDDAEAHAMALLAMGQYGRLLAALEKRLQLAQTLADLHIKASRGRTTIWLPSVEELAQARWAASWDVTSDSLAIWLADQLNASELTLVKSVHCPQSASWTELSECGIVDRAFAQFADRSTCQIRICYREDYGQLAADIARDERGRRNRPATACG